MYLWTYSYFDSNFIYFNLFKKTIEALESFYNIIYSDTVNIKIRSFS